MRVSRIILCALLLFSPLVLRAEVAQVYSSHFSYDVDLTDLTDGRFNGRYRFTHDLGYFAPNSAGLTAIPSGDDENGTEGESPAFSIGGNPLLSSHASLTAIDESGAKFPLTGSTQFPRTGAT
jgi:hypothetical protein